MLDLRGYILLPEYGSDENDKIVVSRDEIAAIRKAIFTIAKRRIAVVSEHTHNGHHIIFIAGFSNHGGQALDAVSEIDALLRPFENRLDGSLKVHIFASDHEQERLIELRLGTPSVPLD